MPIYLIRHGQSEFNVSDHSQFDPMIFDARLTDTGKMQAEQARTTVAGLGIKQVISSPLTRAVQTALTIFDRAVPISIIPHHREMLMFSGDVGRPPAELAADFPTLEFDHLDDHWWHKGPVNGNNVPIEPEGIFFQRVRAFDDVLAEAETRPLAIVGHGNFFLQMIGRMLDNCEVAEYRPVENSMAGSVPLYRA